MSYAERVPREGLLPPGPPERTRQSRSGTFIRQPSSLASTNRQSTAAVLRRAPIKPKREGDGEGYQAEISAL